MNNYGGVHMYIQISFISKLAGSSGRFLSIYTQRKPKWAPEPVWTTWNRDKSCIYRVAKSCWEINYWKKIMDKYTYVCVCVFAVAAYRNEDYLKIYNEQR
jgi:hypothetical protein